MAYYFKGQTRLKVLLLPKYIFVLKNSFYLKVGQANIQRIFSILKCMEQNQMYCKLEDPCLLALGGP